MNKNLKLILVAAIATTFAASAHNVTRGLVNNFGGVVKNSFGQCIEVATNKDNVDCGAEVKQPPAPLEMVSFTLGANALFDTNKSTIRPAGQASLQALANKISQAYKLGNIKEVTNVDVIGHTDSRGKAAYNQKLSERRATSVRNYLVQLGVPANIIKAYGEGEMNPISSNATAKGRQQNRRVNITIKGTSVKKN
ncbi:MAG: OmpA family protein [Ostreibacterium sp.]